MNDRTRSNPLIRRIRRHASLATLFRAPLDALAATLPADQAAQLPRARAYPSAPPTPADMPELSAAPASADALPATRPASTIPTPTIPAQVQRAPAAAPARAAGADPRPVVPPATGQLAKPQTPTAQPATIDSPAQPEPTAADEESALSERDWNRLSTIMRRHQDRNETALPATPAGEAPPEAQPSVRTEQPADQNATQSAGSSTTQDSVQRVDRTAQNDLRGSAPPAVQRASQPAPAPPIQSSPQPPASPGIPSTSPTQAARTSLAARANQPADGPQPAAQPAPPQPARPAGVGQPSFSAPDQDVLSESETGQAVPASPEETHLPIEPHSQAEPPLAMRKAVDPVSMTPPAPVESALKAPGLEDAWPVQRRPAPAPTPANAAQPAPQAVSEPFTPAPLAEQARHAQDIQRALAGVASGQPTGSRIEVIPPRQPRPPQPAPETALVEEAAPVHANYGQPIQRAPAEASPPRMVDTEIGPLPSDLWGLLGQPEPRQAPDPARAAPAPAPDQSAAQPPFPTSSGAAVQRAAEQAQAAESALPRSMQHVQTAGERAQAAVSGEAVQRTVIINDFETVTQAQPGEERPAGQPGGERESEAVPARTREAGQPPAAPDLDEIARQVYADIKNRLQVEWERLRRKV